MKKISILTILTVLTIITNAQIQLKWNDSLVFLEGTKVSQSILLDNVKKPSLQSDFYYAFDKKMKSHIVHIVKYALKNEVKSIYLIYKYLIPANSLDCNLLKIETFKNSFYMSGGYLHLNLSCKENKEEIIVYEKYSHYLEFENQVKTNELSIEAELTEKGKIQKLIQLIKQNK